MDNTQLCDNHNLTHIRAMTQAEREASKQREVANGIQEEKR